MGITTKGPISWHISKFKGPPKYDAKQPFAGGALENEAVLREFGNPALKEGLGSLLETLKNRGRVDPRLLSESMRRNNLSTDQAAGAARSSMAARGWGNLGLGAALQSAIRSGGMNRNSALTYQDLADSYARHQSNLGLLGQLVTQPEMGYAGISSDMYQAMSNADAQKKAARFGVVGSVMGSLGSMFKK